MKERRKHRLVEFEFWICQGKLVYLIFLFCGNFEFEKFFDGFRKFLTTGFLEITSFK